MQTESKTIYILSEKLLLLYNSCSILQANYWFPCIFGYRLLAFLRSRLLNPWLLLNTW
jgi:hypothetical protein